MQPNSLQACINDLSREYNRLSEVRDPSVNQKLSIIQNTLLYIKGGKGMRTANINPTTPKEKATIKQLFESSGDDLIQRIKETAKELQSEKIVYDLTNAAAFVKLISHYLHRNENSFPSVLKMKTGEVVTYEFSDSNTSIRLSQPLKVTGTGANGRPKTDFFTKARGLVKELGARGINYVSSTEYLGSPAIDHKPGHFETIIFYDG